MLNPDDTILLAPFIDKLAAKPGVSNITAERRQTDEEYPPTGLFSICWNDDTDGIHVECQLIYVPWRWKDGKYVHPVIDDWNDVSEAEAEHRAAVLEDRSEQRHEDQEREYLGYGNIKDA